MEWMNPFIMFSSCTCISAASKNFTHCICSFKNVVFDGWHIIPAIYNIFIHKNLVGNILKFTGKLLTKFEKSIFIKST